MGLVLFLRNKRLHKLRGFKQHTSTISQLPSGDVAQLISPYPGITGLQSGAGQGTGSPGLGWEECLPSPLRVAAAFPPSEPQGRVSGVSPAVGQGPLQLPRPPSASCHIAPSQAVCVAAARLFQAPSRPQRQSHMTKANLGSGVCRVKGPHWETGPPSPHLTLCSAEESPGAQKVPAERQGSPGLTGQTH